MIDSHNIQSVQFLTQAPDGGYTDESPVKVTYLDGSTAQAVWGSDVGNGGVLRWREEGGVALPWEPDYLPLTPKQLRLGLLSIGITSDAVYDAIEAIENPVEREAATIEWEYSQTYHKDHPLIAAVAASLSLSDETVNSAWLNAQTIV